MKLKEIPKSVFRSLQLRAIPLSRLINPEQPELPVVVSFTSIPQRLPTADLVVRSLLTQSRIPQKIVLWLPDSARKAVPKRLENLLHKRFEIRPTPLTVPHKKLIHSLEAFPDQVVITCDDDLMYRRQWLETLYQTHLEQPACIVGHQLRQIRYNEDGTLMPYRSWTLGEDRDENRRAVMAIGAGGVLYPPDSLDSRVQDTELFRQLCPRADDLWFKMMGLLAGTSVIPAKVPAGEPIPIMGTQRYSLKKTNIKKDENRVQWQALTDFFDQRP